MRIFIAIELPENIKDYLKEIQKDLSGIKGSLVKDFHLTLKFLGELEENKIEKIKEKLSEIKFDKFLVNLGKIGFFPTESYIRVVWIGIEPEEKITEVQKKVDEAMKEFGFKDDFKFKSHLTLARVKFIDDKKTFVEKLKKLEIKPLEFDVSSFSLMKSTLTSEGPVYEELKKFQPKPL